MGFLVKLAYKNLWRQKRRTVLTTLAISVGMVVLITTDSLYTGFDNLGITNLRKLETGDIKIHAPGYFAAKDELPIDMTISGADILATVRQVDGVEAAAPRLAFTGRLNNGVDEVPVIAVGIDPVADPTVFALPEYTAGRLPAAGAQEAVLGGDLAGIMELAVGDYFTLITRTRDDAFQALDFTVVGIVGSPHPQVNQSMVYVPLDVAAAGLAMAGQVTEVSIRVQEGLQVKTVAKAVGSALGGTNVEVFTWREVAAEFLALGQADKAFVGAVLFFIVLIAAVGVVNTILLGAMERRREIGMMKALGMTEKEIVKLFVYEAAAIGVLASILGCAVAIGGTLYMANVGIDFSKYWNWGDLDIGYPVIGRVYGGWNWPLIAIAFLCGIAVSVVASYVPARIAAQDDPIISLRHA